MRPSEPSTCVVAGPRDADTAVLRRRATGTELQAVLFDMDGTLLDSEHLWQIALAELARELGGTVSVALQAAVVGAHTDKMVRTLHDELAPDADPARSARFLLSRTAELFRDGLLWRPGAQELLADVFAAGIPVALVTSTERVLVELALDTLGRNTFAVTVCGDEVDHPKPHPGPYRRAAQLLGVDPAHCVAVEDSPVGVASAEAAGCVVLAVPSEVKITPGPRRTVRVGLIGVTAADLADLVRS